MASKPRARLLFALENSILKFGSIIDSGSVLAGEGKSKSKHDMFKRRDELGEFRHLYQQLRADPETFSEYCRMLPSTFDYILEAIRPHISYSTTNFQKPISVEERLFVALRYLSTGMSFGQLAFTTHIGKSTISTIVKEICTVIWQTLQPQHMPIPTKEQLEEVAKEFYLRWNFPNCVGSIDGKHIRVKCPPNSGSQYYSIVLQSVVDANLKFITVDVGTYGRQSDGDVFRYSALYQSLETQHLKLPPGSVLPKSNVELPHVFIGNEAYPLSTYLMKPYSKRALDKDKTIFNYRLSRARRVAECAFRICVEKWRILNKCIETKVDTAVEIVEVVTLLHNIIIDAEGLNETAFSMETDTSRATEMKRTRANNAVSSSAKTVRDKFCQYFNSPCGSVPWQDQAIEN